MPQLDKFTYFTQFLWLCLFLFTFYLGSKLNIERRLSLLFLINPAFQGVVFWLKGLLVFFILIRTGFLLWHNLYGLLCPQTLFSVLPSELGLLNHYLRQSHQDPEWVEYVHQVLRTTPTVSASYEVLVRDLLNTEVAFSTREQICSFYQLIFYGREDPQFWIDPLDLEAIVKGHLEPKEFDPSALGEVLKSLFTERHNSPFYEDVKTAQADHFRGFLKQKQQARVEMQERLNSHTEWEYLSKRMTSLAEENRALREKISILARKTP
uniref:ATP synthase YMF19-like N-terminal domain-containing protein n=1 Tax=Solanum tuberosum TaxID=4113 RepID=A0A5J6CZF9_SOLTU|nr:hypothetical protein [Solanum tuberosum]